MRLTKTIIAIVSRMRWAPTGIPLAAGALTAFIGLAAPTTLKAQITPISQTRTINASANCFSGCTPVSDSRAANDFNRFNELVRVSVSGGPQYVAQSEAAQDTTIGTSSISGSVRTSVTLTLGSGNAASVCSVAFRIDQACSYSYTATHGSGAFAAFSTLRLTGPFGQVFSFQRNSGSSSSSGLLPAGQYTFLAQAISSAAGSFGVSNCDSIFNLALTGLPTPSVVAGPITNPATCHRYYQLSTSGWLEAQAAAEQLGGDLVTINNAAENAWVQSTFAPLGPQHKWIGLSALAAPDTTTFAWISGEPFTYFNWVSNPVAGQGNFVLMQTGVPNPGRWLQSQNAYTQNIVGGVVEVAPCVCDWNTDTFVNSADFFAFLTDFFANNADVNCSGSTTSDDFFDFLTCFFNGCG